MKNGSLYFGAGTFWSQLRTLIAENKTTIVLWLSAIAIEFAALWQFLTAKQSAGASFAFFGYSVVRLFYALWIAGELRATPDGSVGKEGRIEEHVGHIKVMVFTMLLGVVAIEVAVRKEGGLWGPLWLMFLHFSLVISSLLTLLTSLVFNGKTDKKLHRAWAPRFALSYVATVGTGCWLLGLKFIP